MADFILALDQGTTSSRAILFDRQGSISALAQQEFRQYYPRAGWVEHDADEVWAAQSRVIQQALAKAKIGAADIAAIGITNQRETTVVWDRRSGEPIHPAIVWQDRRTSAYIDELKVRGLQPLFQRKTGLILDAYFSASKLVWLLEHVDGARLRAQAGELAFGTIDSWLVYKLTGGQVHVTDVSNASRTLLFNIHTLQWDSEILELLGIPETLLPAVKPSSEIYAETAIPLFEKPLPIAGIAGDQHAATFGQTCFDTGQGKNTYGTGCFMMLNTGESALVSKHQLLTTIAWQCGSRGGAGSNAVPGLNYALEGSVFIAGDAVRWLRDGLGIIRDFRDIQALAQQADDNGGVYFVPAFAGLGAPHWDQYARGAVFGLTGGSSRGHIARAVLEGIAFQVADVFNAMQNDCGLALKELRVDGGAVKNDLLMQIQADLLGVPVLRPRMSETTALGAAYLAGLAVGFWPDKEALKQHWLLDRQFEPVMSPARRLELFADWRKAVDRTKNWVDH